MKRTLYIAGIAALTTLGLTAMTQATVIASYDFNGADRTAQLQDKALSAEVDASVFSFGAGLLSTTPIVNTAPSPTSYVYDEGTGNAVAGPLSGDQHTLIGTESTFGFSDRSGTGGSTEATAITDNDYLQFSFTVEAGQMVDMGILSWREYSRNTTRGASDWSIFVSYDDFATSDLMGTGIVTDNFDYYEQSVDLSSEATLLASDTATIRLYMYGKTHVSAFNSEQGFDSFSLATVPEPSTTALLGLGGFALILRRRK
jgi:hypothetical protein